jgi:hypothetical protein
MARVNPLLPGLHLGPVTLSKGGGVSIASVLAILAKGTASAWWTPQSGLIYQDNAGTTPAVAANDVIGLQLDQAHWGGKTLAQELAAQPELCPNGSFPSGSTTGWAVWNTGGVISSANGSLTITQASSANQTGAGIAISTVAGQFYEASFNLLSTSGGAQFRIGTFNGAGDVAISTTSPSTGIRNIVFQAVGATTFFNVATQNTIGNFAQFGSVSVKALPGNHALQASTSLKPTLQFNGSLPIERFDGVDDYLLSPLIPGAATTYIFKGLQNTTGRPVMGASDAVPARSFIALGIGGQLAAGVGSQGIAVITGGPVITGVLGTGALTYDGTTVNLYWNGANVYSAAQASAGQTTIPVSMGSYNNNGTPSTSQSANLYHTQMIAGYAATAAEIATITTYLNSH